MSPRCPGLAKIGLALSGGGVRAAIFHLGVLRRLADEGLLENVSHISSVSGGSLAIAVVMSESEMEWPTSSDYLTHVFPRLQNVLTTVDLFSLRAVGLRGLFRFNRRLLGHRASIVADLLADRWGVRGDVKDLPESPVWWINTTSLLTGKNWRFARREMGDWQFGAHYNPPFRLADAVAASAAVPYVIGALTLKLPDEGWFDRHPSTRAPVKRKLPEAKTVRLWDGGAYENLGLEALYKPQQPLLGCDFLISSDASGELRRGGRFAPFDLLRGKLASPRLFDIASDQTRALRVRMFLADIASGRIRGAMVRMGNSVRDIHIKGNAIVDGEAYDDFQTDEEVRFALLHPTDLRAVSGEVFERLSRHGYEVADATLRTHSGDLFEQSFTWGSRRT